MKYKYVKLKKDNMEKQVLEEKIIITAEAREIESLINFVFLVHNDIEFDVAYKSLSGFFKDKNVLLKYIDDHQIYFIGRFGEQIVALTKTGDMGVIKPFAAQILPEPQ